MHVDSSPGNNLGSQVTCNSSNSEESPSKHKPLTQKPQRPQVQTPTATINAPLTESLGMTDRGRFGSFVSNQHVGARQYSDRVPVRLVFKNS